MKQKKILITGGSRGIGKKVFELLNNDKNTVFLISNNQNRINQLKKNSGSKNIHIFKCDLQNYKKMKKIIKSIGHIDILINNASINIIKSFEKFSLLDANRMIDINFKSYFFCTQEVLRNRKKNNDEIIIINISSIMGKVAQPIDSDRPQLMYICLKHAIEGLTKGICTEYAGKNVRINSVCPTYVNTKLVEKTLKDKKKRNKIINKIPSKRIAETIDVANVVQFLCSDKSKMINGTSIMVDGGWTSY